MTTRRGFMAGTIALGAAMLPFGAVAQEGPRTFQTDDGDITVHPIEHASFVMETRAGLIFVDPVGDPALYDGFGDPDLILITHEHGDHYDPETLDAVSAMRTQFLTNRAVYDMMGPERQAKAQWIANGNTTDALGIQFEAVPAYNTTEGRLEYHPQGRDNGYVFEIGGRRIYIAGDTEGTPEMRGLEDIFLAFVPMNLPYTMDAEQAADAVAEFSPRHVYPYHYRGADGGTQDPEAFREMLSGTDVDVILGEWYPGGLG